MAEDMPTMASSGEFIEIHESKFNCLGLQQPLETE